MTHLRSKLEQRRYVGAHGIAQLLLWSGFYYVLPALGAQIAEQTGWPVLYISTTYTFAFLVWAVCSPVMGMLIDAGHGPKVMRGGAVAGILLMIFTSQVTDKTIFSVLVVLMGACMAATLYDPCFAIMMRRLKSGSANAIAAVTLVAGFATLVTFPLVIGLSHVLDWREILLAFAGLAAVGVILLPSENTTPAEVMRDTSRVPIERGPVLIAVSFGLVMMGHAILLFLLPVTLAESGNGGAAMLALAILGPAQIAGRIVWRYYGQRFAAKEGAIWMFVCLCLPALILLLTGAPTPAIYVALAIQGACYGVHTILRPSLVQSFLRPAHLGRGLGAVAMVGLLMMAVGPAFGGFVWTVAGATGLMIAVLCLNVCALILGLVLRGLPTLEVAT